MLALAPASRGQEVAKRPPRIADNSFLVEEAYNQEAGVVQHITNFRRARTGDWAFTFTQEWPAPSQRHQLSYTVPLLSASGAGTGVGDLAINYRYQAIGRDEEPVWFSPRISALLPAFDARAGRGAGGPGVQVNLPLSVDIASRLVTHWNASATLTRARSDGGARATTRSFGAGASAIFLATPTLNFMLEGVWERTQALDPLGPVVTARSALLVPGVRGAFNLSSGMQIVPGVGIPIEVGTNDGARDLFLYLSVEHSFR